MTKCGCNDTPNEINPGFRKAVKIVALLNLSYFFIEFVVARSIGSVSLFADSVDFLEDASVNLLILIAMNWSSVHRARVGMLLAALILIPGASALWAAGQKFFLFIPPSPVSLSITGAGALVVNFSCALLLTRYREHSGSMARAAFLSARNDVLANIAIIAAGLITVLIPTAWPDLVVGLAIAFMNIGAAKEVFEAAKEEHEEASA